MNSLFSFFSGSIRQVAWKDITEMQRDALTLACPRFIDRSPLRSDGKTYKEHQIARLEGLNADAVFNYRRFAGGSDLASGNYFSVMPSSDSQNRNSLQYELLSYIAPQLSGNIRIFDCLTLNAMDWIWLSSECGVESDSLDVFMQQHKTDLVVIFDYRKGGMPFHVADTLALYPSTQIGRLKWVIFVSTTISDYKIENCVDLRSPSTRNAVATMLNNGLPTNTLYTSRVYGFHLGLGINEDPQTLSEKDVDIFFRKIRKNTDTAHHFQPSIYWSGGYGTNWPTGFPRLLAYLMCTALGGSPILDVLARYLIKLGAAALIFPSARNDVDVFYDREEMVGWSGWNLVKYEGAPKPKFPFQIIHEPESWMSEMSGLKLTIADENSVRSGSFALKGLSHSVKQLANERLNV